MVLISLRPVAEDIAINDADEEIIHVNELVDLEAWNAIDNSSDEEYTTTQCPFYKFKDDNFSEEEYDQEPQWLSNPLFSNNEQLNFIFTLGEN
jgi:hypothetical protein